MLLARVLLFQSKDGRRVDARESSSRSNPIIRHHTRKGNFSSDKIIPRLEQNFDNDPRAPQRWNEYEMGLKFRVKCRTRA